MPKSRHSPVGSLDGFGSLSSLLANRAHRLGHKSSGPGDSADALDALAGKSEGRVRALLPSWPRPSRVMTSPGLGFSVLRLAIAQQICP